MAERCAWELAPYEEPCQAGLVGGRQPWHVATGLHKVLQEQEWVLAASLDLLVEERPLHGALEPLRQLDSVAYPYCSFAVVAASLDWMVLELGLALAACPAAALLAAAHHAFLGCPCEVQAAYYCSRNRLVPHMDSAALLDSEACQLKDDAASEPWGQCCKPEECTLAVVACM